MKKLQTLSLMLVLLFIIVFSGCLTVEQKLYTFEIENDGSGRGTIKFINLVSEEDDEKDVSFKDFGELISDYIEGTQFENDNPHYYVLSKDLYEENGVLVGEVNFTFNHADSIGFFKTEGCNCAPYMYYMGSLSETLIETDGEYLGDDFPVIIWSNNTRKFVFKTSVKEDMSDAHPLLPLYNTWKQSQE